MNIKQAESLSGVTRQNIRFYEKQGLLTPARNPGNDYREYSESDIERLKWVRAMRMLDMPLEDIRQVLSGSMSLSQAASCQQDRLEHQRKKLEGAIRFCGVLQRSGSLSSTDVDACLATMEQEDVGYFQQWKLDYLATSKAEHQRLFTFLSEEPITTPAEFTNALLAFAKSEELDLVITQEGMYPLFTIDGIEYTASRNFNTAGRGGLDISVRCEMTHPEDYLPPVPEKRRKFLSILGYLVPGLALFLIIAVPMCWDLLSSGENPWLVLLALVSIGGMIGLGCYRSWLFYFNRKGQ